MQSARYSGQILINFQFSQRIFEQFLNMKFHENPSLKEPIFSMRREGQTDRHDEPSSRFHSFTEKPKDEF